MGAVLRVDDFTGTLSPDEATTVHAAQLYRDWDGLPPKPPVNPLVRLQGQAKALTTEGAKDVPESPQSLREKAKALRIKKLSRLHELATLLGNTEMAHSFARRVQVLRKTDAGPRKKTRHRWRG